MSHLHIDARLGPERNPRQGVGAADILRWQEAWRQQKAERRAARAAARELAESPMQVRRRVSSGMDEFFAKVGELPGAWKPSDK